MTYREVGGGPAFVYVAFGGHVFALERTTGRRVWGVSIGSTQAPRIVVEGERLFVLGPDLVCLEALTGKILWTAPANGSTLLVDGDLVFVGGQGEAAAYRALDGTFVWRDAFKGYGLGWVAIAVEGNAEQADISG